MRAIPSFIEDGIRVLEYSLLQEKVLPIGYQPSVDAGNEMSLIDLFVIAIGAGIDGELPNEYGLCDAVWAVLNRPSAMI